MGVCIPYKKNIEVIENKKEYENENNYDKKKEDKENNSGIKDENEEKKEEENKKSDFSQDSDKISDKEEEEKKKEEENNDDINSNIIINNALNNQGRDGIIQFIDSKNKINKSLEINRKSKEVPLNLYKIPTLIGLNNIGATCFMNSTLQCLSQTKALSNYFLKESNKNKIINNNLVLKNKNNLSLSPDFLKLIQELWEKNGPKSFSPNYFMNKVNNMNPLFKEGQAGDSKDFIIFVLEQLHKELKEPVKYLNNNLNDNEALNQYDKNNAFNHFLFDFQKDCSIISDIFFGFKETTNECLNCKNNYNSKKLNHPICYNYGIFNCLIFYLEEIKNKKNNLIENNNIQNNNNIVSLNECFLNDQRIDLFTGKNKNYCNICKQLSDSIYTTKIFVSPNVLILILNRGKGNIYDVKLDFNETIDISPFVLLKDYPQIIYNLYGVITHIGESGPNAHFIASCKSPIDKKWYRYNDEIVSPITNIQEEVIEFGAPYILFYEKK